MIKFIKKTRWYAWLFLAWSVLNIIYFVVQEKNYYAAFFAGAYYFMVFLFLHCMETIKKTLQKENGSDFENAVALYVFFLAVVAGHFTAFWCVAFLFMFFVFDYCMDKMKKLDYCMDKMKNLVNDPQGSEFERAVAFEKLYKKHENLILENFELKSDLSKKDLEITKMQQDQKSYLIKILLENKDFLKMCDDLLQEGKEKYPNDDWKEIDFKEHFKKAKGHLAKEIKGEISDHCAPHGVSAMVRMIFGMINKYKK
jgi:hypothetical protein